MVKRINHWAETYQSGRIVLDCDDGTVLDTNKLAVPDTGWRALTATPGSTARTGTGTMQVRRTGAWVTWRLNEVGITDGTGAVILVHANEFPPGFTPYSQGTVFHVSHEAGSSYVSTLKVAGSLYWIGLTTGTALSLTRSGVQLQGEFSYLTADPWPALLPGTPV